MNRYLHSFFCDDIRQEVGNKLSFMGMYQGVMFVPAFPAELQKLCISFSVSTLADDPFKSLSFIVLRNDEKIVEHELPPEAMPQQGPDEYEFQQLNGAQQVQMLQAFIVLPNVKIDAPCVFRVRAITEREELKAPGLKVLLNETSS